MSSTHVSLSRNAVHPHHHSPFAYLAVISLIGCTCLALTPVAVLAIIWVVVRSIIAAA